MKLNRGATFESLEHFESDYVIFQINFDRLGGGCFSKMETIQVTLVFGYFKYIRHFIYVLDELL